MNETPELSQEEWAFLLATLRSERNDLLIVYGIFSNASTEDAESFGYKSLEELKETSDGAWIKIEMTEAILKKIDPSWAILNGGAS